MGKMSLCRLLFRLANFSLSSLARHQDGRSTLAASDHELILMRKGSSLTCKESLLSCVKGRAHLSRREAWEGDPCKRTLALMSDESAPASRQSVWK